MRSGSTGVPVKTPTRNELALPTKKLADAVVAEWEAVEKTIDPAHMPMTGFANAAIDHIGADRDGFVTAIAAYGETDLLCYRAAADEPLGARQAAVWDPWLDWARARYDVSFVIVEGIMHQPQPRADACQAARSGGGARDVRTGGNGKARAFIGFAGVDAGTGRAGRGRRQRFGTRACLDELWQEELWGADHWADKNRADRRGRVYGCGQVFGSFKDLAFSSSRRRRGP